LEWSKETKKLLDVIPTMKNKCYDENNNEEDTKNESKFSDEI